MRIVLATYGSEGDVRPMLALAAGLSGSGHEVVVVAEGAAASLADRIGVEFHALAGDIRSILSSGAHGTGEVMRTGRPRLTTLTRMARLHSGEWLETIDAAAGGADAILGSSLVVYHALSVAHARRVQPIAAGYQPYAPTRDFVSPFTGLVGTPRWLNRPVTEAVNETIWLSYRGPLNAARRALGQRPVRRAWNSYPVLCAWSPTLVPNPPDWPWDRITVTGAWHRAPEASWTPPADLAAFLDAGEPPVYVGFGSMTGFGGATRLRDTILAGLSGRRALVASGWAGLADADLPAGVHAVGHVPHDWLFARCAAVIHHCGAGTTHAAARCGTPQVPVPMVADQPFWADRVRRAGIASEKVDRHRTTVCAVRAAVDQATSLAVRRRAQEVAELMRGEDGVAAAVARIEQIVRR